MHPGAPRLRERVGVVEEGGDGRRLLLGRGARRVVALERQQEHEGQQHGVGRARHGEHPGGLLGVAEEAALGRAPPQQQHHGHRDGIGDDEQDDRQRRTHAARHHIRVRDRPDRRVTGRG
jgi:hypothetical protein